MAITYLAPERGRGDEDIWRVELSLPLSAEELIALRAFLANDIGFNQDADQIDEIIFAHGTMRQWGPPTGERWGFEAPDPPPPDEVGIAWGNGDTFENFWRDIAERALVVKLTMRDGRWFDFHLDGCRYPDTPGVLEVGGRIVVDDDTYRFPTEFGHHFFPITEIAHVYIY